MDKRKLHAWAWFLVAAGISLLVICGGIVRACLAPHDFSLLAAGSVCLVGCMVAFPLWQAISRNCPEPREQMLLPLTERMDQLAILLNLMSEQQLLSDRAISIAYREKDREALRRAVHEEMGRKDWDAALTLVDEMERAFGNKTEAQAYRKEINDHRNDLARKQINEAIQVIDKHTRTEQWNAAVREADKLIVLFPDNEQVKNLPNEIDNRRQAFKKQLLQNWHEAVARHDNDGSIEILKQLDPYLTPAEAETMQETVRGVFKERLTNLGAQFATAVKDQKLSEAVRIGEAITKEYPNTRMAQEVRDVLETLRKRGTEPAVAPV
ncbi:MAG TPA: hypothetical protein VFE47_21515 [Tepidisphaeraceae bacterium]|nr:hypothetical protein [Tepidisphaeraceae bacterium]